MPKRLFELYLLGSRWLLAPFLVMMTAGLVALLIKAGKKTYGLVGLLLSNDYDHITLQVLTLIDTMLIGALVMIVTVSVYENFISRIPREQHGEWPNWMGAIDFSQLKLKLMSTLVAISAIKLLEALIDASEISDRDMNYFIGVHVTFVVSTLAFALSEKVSAHAPSDETPHEQ